MIKHAGAPRQTYLQRITGLFWWVSFILGHPPHHSTLHWPSQNFLGALLQSETLPIPSFFLLSFLPQVSRLESSLWFLLPPPQQISHTPNPTLASASQKTQTNALTNTLQTILLVGRYPMESWTGTPGDCTRIHERRHSKWNKLMFWPHLLCFSCLTYETI